MPHGGTESPGTARSCSKSDLDELSRQMKENIVQLKSLLGIRSKDYQIPWSERDALSLPATRSGSLIYEGHGSLLIPSKQSAFTQLSTWSLPAADAIQMELENSMHTVSARSMDRLSHHKEPIRDRYSRVAVRNSTQQTERYASSSSEEESEKSRYTRKSDRHRTMKVRKTSQRNDQEKFEQAQKKALWLQRRCDQLERENEKNKKVKQDKIDKIADLKHRNSELVKVAKRLEEKAKALHAENCKRNSEPDTMDGDAIEQKKNFASILAQVQTDHEKQTKERDKEMKILKNQIQDLKKALGEAKSLQLSMNGGASLKAAMKQTQKESLRLQKLAAEGNKKVTIRSLSMPVTARQKILEETNRTLRRQLAEYEEAGQSLAGRTVEDLKAQSVSQTRCSELEKVNRELSLQTVNLESQLQIAKVESSDTNIKLSELKSTLEQLQRDYDTVHHQLAVAIKERDSAIEQCKQKANEISADLQIRSEREKIVDYDGRVCGQESEIMIRDQLADSDHPDDDKPKILDVMDLQPEHDDARVRSFDHEGEEQGHVVQVADDGKASSEAEEVPEEIITSAMDDSETEPKLFIAKYTYNPMEGPNDFPEMELPLFAGDYVYVVGPMDADGFYEGELMNGIRGLVPSNFLDPVLNELELSDLDRHDNHMNDALHKDNIFQNSGDAFLEPIRVMASHSALLRGVVPYPQKLQIVKQLSHSLIIGWSAPAMNSEELVSEYYVYVNRKFKTAVSGKKLNAVVEDIDHNQISRIEVCAVTSLGISDVTLCVMTHGNGSNLAPTEIHTEKIGSSSARVAWTPSTSQQGHIVTVTEEGCSLLSTQNPTKTTHSVPSPAYRLTIDNLKPNMKYTVSVALEGSIGDMSEPFLSFTTPEAGPPDPPLGVQVEECSNKNYLLVTWLPVTLNTLGTSNGVVVSGYSIHVGEMKVHEVHSPTLDQCTIRAQSLADAVKQHISSVMSKYPDSDLSRTTNFPQSVHYIPSIYIRTHAVNGQESDLSDPCSIPKELYQKLMESSKGELMESSKGDDRMKTETPSNDGSATIVPSLESTDVEVSFSSDTSMPGFNSTNNTEASYGIRASTKHKTDVFKQTRIVPSIEITYDPSTDDELTQNEARQKLQGIVQNSTRIDVANADYIDPVVFETERNAAAKKLSGLSNISNFEDNIPFSSNLKNTFNLSDRAKNLTNGKHLSNHSQKPHRYQEDLKVSGKRPVSVASDEQSVGSHFSQSSSRHGHISKSKNKANSRILRQSTMSSQSENEMASEVESSFPPHVNFSKIGLYVAVYPYDPKTMSPNTNSFDEELTFAQGQLIKIFGGKDEDGFYYGETSTGARGYVPCNLVNRLEQVATPDIDDFLKRGYLPSASPDEEEQSTAQSQCTTKSILKGKDGAEPAKSPVKRFYRAQHDYDPQQHSPNIDPDTELSFKCGDVITVYGDMDGDGFFQGELGGKSGLVPSNFLDEIPKKRVEISQPERKSPKSSRVRINHRETSAIGNNPKHSDLSDYGSHSSQLDQVGSRKKNGLLSKGKKLFKKLGGSQDGKRR